MGNDKVVSLVGWAQNRDLFLQYFGGNRYLSISDNFN